MSIFAGSPSSAQNFCAQGPGAITTCSPTAIRPWSVWTAVTVSSAASSKPVTSVCVWIWTPSERHLSRRPATASMLKAKPPWCSCRQTVTPLRAPVREQLLHVRVDLGLAEVELRAVADPLVALEDLLEVALLHLRPERDVADAVVVVGLGVRLPDLDAGLHQLAHGGLEVVVADDPAGDPRRARSRCRLLEHDHVGSRALPALPELDGEVVGGREAVHAGADDDEAGRSGYHRNCLPGNGVSKTD